MVVVRLCDFNSKEQMKAYKLKKKKRSMAGAHLTVVLHMTQTSN